MIEPGTRGSLLEIDGLTIEYHPRSGTRGAPPTVRALKGISLHIAAGEVLGVLGESGSGKSTLALAIPGLLPPGGLLTSGTILFDGRSLHRASERELESLRGARIGCILQHPGQALHPLKRIGQQVIEVLRAHDTGPSNHLEAIAARRLVEAGIDDPSLFHALPSQLSGGQQQRVFIAQAIACSPSLIIADEPTAALDSVHRRQITHLLRRLAKSDRSGVLFITHQPDLLAQIADRVLVLYRGRAVETGTTAEVLGNPRHPYTAALLACVPPGPGSSRAKKRLPTIPLARPDSAPHASACPYSSRCSRLRPVCEREAPAPRNLSSTRTIACHDPLP